MMEGKKLDKSALDHIKRQKKSNREYLFELQKFLDVVDNIHDTDLKNRIIAQMLKLEEALAKLIDDSIKKQAKI